MTIQKRRQVGSNKPVTIAQTFSWYNLCGKVDHWADALSSDRVKTRTTVEVIYLLLIRTAFSTTIQIHPAKQLVVSQSLKHD